MPESGAELDEPRSGVGLKGSQDGAELKGLQGDVGLAKVVGYMKAHWPSKVREEWQVGVDEYPPIVKKAVADLTAGASRNRQLIRVAGISGSGKTTQILPAVEVYCDKHDLSPVLVAARVFVEYHPHYKEIRDYYGEENVRKMTDEFATIMLFLVLAALIREGYDIVLDVTLLDPEMEGILVKMLRAAQYKMMLLMVAVSPVVTEKFLAGRAWRHTAETEREFVRATAKALEFYADAMPGGRVIMWSVYDLRPVYDGDLAGCLKVFREYSGREEMPGDDDEARREAKIKYLTNI